MLVTAVGPIVEYIIRAKRRVSYCVFTLTDGGRVGWGGGGLSTTSNFFSF